MLSDQLEGAFGANLMAADGYEATKKMPPILAI
jgi:hypothetical protein